MYNFNISEWTYLLKIRGMQNAIKNGFGEMTQLRIQTLGNATVFVLGTEKSNFFNRYHAIQLIPSG